jgi:L-amino acid N-acyltransferase YncA
MNDHTSIDDEPWTEVNARMIMGSQTRCGQAVPLSGEHLQVKRMKPMEIRDAREADLPAMREIYNEVLAGSTAIFSEVQRTPEVHAQWFEERRAQGWPVLVACSDDDVIGYATYGPFRSWPGYRYTVENSIYLDARVRGRGLGVPLLGALLDRARAQGLHAMIAGIDGENHASMRLHEKLGFTKVGHLSQVGRKFDRWLDLVFYQRLLEE